MISVLFERSWKSPVIKQRFKRLMKHHKGNPAGFRKPLLQGMIKDTIKDYRKLDNRQGD